MKTIAIDFDGVVHSYEKGWHDGTVYGDAVEGAFSAIKALMDKGYCVYIFSCRDANQIVRWIQDRTGELHDEPINYIFKCQKIRFWVKTWNKPGVLGVTNRKLPAEAYIDDRGIRFEGWEEVLKLF